MEIYHILSRGVDKRQIFMDNEDHFRFIHDLFEFNDENWVNNVYYKFHNKKDATIKNKREPRKLLVDIYAFCLMPNHYHILLKARKMGNITNFMRKLNIGYAKYFNNKYKRSGALFEGRYKFILVKDESHFLHLPYYIHLNPLDLKYPEWRVRKLKNYKKAVEFLKSYRWSSHLDYLGEKNFPSVTNRDFLSDVFNGREEYKKSIYLWLKDLSLENIKEITL